MAVCYRHPGRETGVSCSNCGNPICPDCMTATPVGMRCPECSRQKTPVRTMRNIYAQPTVTYILIGICVLHVPRHGARAAAPTQVYIDLGTLGSARTLDGVRSASRRASTGGWSPAPSCTDRQSLHIAFNMYILYWLGTMLEPVLGHVRFTALYFASLLAGSFGAILAKPHSLTVGASGAVFGLMAAAFVFQRARGIDPWRSGLGPVILLNLALPFVFPGLNISIGGHIGGLIGGAIAALAIDRLGQVRRGDLYPLLACVAVGAISVVGAVAVSSG